MRRKPIPQRTVLGLNVAALLLMFATGTQAASADDQKTIRLDCGVNALFVLLRLEGRPASIDELQSVLPTPQNEGYSMAELASAARSRGLPLDGVRLVKGDPTPLRPAIVFLHAQRGGHFAVLRPVGTTRKMVQVIDPPSAPWIIDLDRVLASEKSTGRFLVPRDPRVWHMVPTGLLAGAFALLILGTSRLRRSRRRPHSSLTSSFRRP